MNEPKAITPIVSSALFGVWVDVTKELPPEGESVLIHLTKTNWGDDKGVYFKVAKLERGISASEREKMKSGEIPDTDEYGWIAPNDQWQKVTTKRSATIKGADEYGNNRRPFQWVDHGPGNYFGQEVDYWMRIPPMNTPNEKGQR